MSSSLHTLLIAITIFTFSHLSAFASSDVDHNFVAYIQQTALQIPASPWQHAPFNSQQWNVSSLYEHQDVAVVFVCSSKYSRQEPSHGIPPNNEQIIYQSLSELESQLESEAEHNTAAEHVRFLSGVCDSLPTGKSAACVLARMVDAEALPLVLTYHNGKLVRALSTPWLQMDTPSTSKTQQQHGLSINALRQWVLLLASPRATRLNHVDEVLALPGLVQDDKRGLGAVVVLSTGGGGDAGCADSSAVAIAESVRGIATVYVVPVTAAQELSWRGSVTAATDNEEVEGRCHVLVLRRESPAAAASPADDTTTSSKKKKKVKKQTKTPEVVIVRTPLHEAVDRLRSAESTNEYVVVSPSFQCQGGQEEQCVAHVAEHVLPRVVFSSPQRREVLAATVHQRDNSSCPSVLALYFIPNLLATLPQPFGQTMEASSPTGHALLQSNPQVRYYSSRLATALNSILDEDTILPSSMSDACRNERGLPRRVMVVDPTFEKDLFYALSFQSSDIYQTTADQQENSGKSFSGKTRDNLLVLFINGTWQATYTKGFFDLKHIQTMLAKNLQWKTAHKEAHRVSEKPIPIAQKARFPHMDLCRDHFAGSGHAFPPVPFLNMEATALTDVSRDTAFLVYNSDNLAPTQNTSKHFSIAWKTKLMVHAVEELARGEQGDSGVRFFSVDLALDSQPNIALPSMYSGEELGFFWVKRSKKPTYNSHRTTNSPHTSRHVVVNCMNVVEGAHKASKVTFQEEWRTAAEVFMVKWYKRTTTADVHEALVKFAKRHANVPLRLGAGLPFYSENDEDTLVQQQGGVFEEIGEESPSLQVEEDVVGARERTDDL